MTDLGRRAPGELHQIVVGLDLHNRDALETFLSDVNDPASPVYHHFLTQDEFNALFAPTPAEEEAVVAHLEGHGLQVTERAPNRLIVRAAGTVAAIERAFGVGLHDVHFRGVRHFAAVDEPRLPPDLAAVVVGVIGLDDLEERHSHIRSTGSVRAPNAALGSNCCHLAPSDLRRFYDDAVGYDGTGQTIVIAGAFAWKSTDVSSFDTQWGLPSLPAGSGQVCTGTSGSTGCRFSRQNSIEIALDSEYAHGTAPGARILNYMAASTANADFTTMYNRIVTDNPGHVVTTSWGACEAGLPTATQQTDDDIFANANAIGQAWFGASGDSGSRDCSNLLTVDNPANSPHVIGVGGTTPTCSSGMTPASSGCGGYGSESAWSGSGGGISQLFLRPAFQTGCAVPGGLQRLVPDVSLEADTSPGDYVFENGSWYIVGGTSGAAPQWAAFMAQLTQKAGGAGLGNPGALLYGLCGTTAYHDVTTGSNGDYAAAPGYDLVTGLGTIEASNFLALANPGGTTTSTTTSSTSTSLALTTTSSSSTTSTTSTTTTSSKTSTTVTTTTSSTTTSSATSSTTSSTSTSLAPTTSSSSSSTTSSTSSTTASSSTTSTTVTTTSSTTTSSATSSTTSSTSTSLVPTTSSSTSLAPTTTSSSTSTTSSTSPSPTTSTTSTTLPGGTCAAPIVLPATGGTVTGTTAGASAFTGCSPATSTAPEQVFQWTPAASGTATIQTCGAATKFDTVVSVLSGSCTGASIGCNDDTVGCGTGDVCSPNNQHHGSVVTAAVTQGQTYVIVVDGYSGSCGGASGAFSLTVTPP